jgi:hypothetical protein
VSEHREEDRSGEGAVGATSGRWRLTLGTVLGREHHRLGRNNQDAVAGCESNGALSIVVADGCGEGAFSEVGSRLVARFVSQRACDVAPERVVEELVSWLEGISREADFIQEQLLTTFLCAVARGESVTVFGIGDGVVFVDGVTTVLEPDAGNAPDYVAYRVLGRPVEVQVHHLGPAKRVAIGTDGARGIELASSFGWKNPQALQRRLNLTAGLQDDCSIALLDLDVSPHPSSAERSVEGGEA